MRLKSRVLGNPLRNLVGLFIFWKILLLLVACGSPGPGYDTSTSLVLLHKSDDTSALQPILQYVVNKLTRWDAIYFVQVSNRGYLFEQEWAFGWGFTRLIAFFITTLRAAGLPHYQDLEAAVAVVIAHTSHFFAVLSLFFLTKAVFPNSSSDNFAFRTAALHIISPAGMFLSAPFAESTCAFLSFAGSLIFTQSLVVEGPSTLGHDLLVMVSGVTFGIATTFRSNGILNGLLLLEEAFRSLLRLRYGFRFVTIRRLVATGLGGLSVAAGFLLPQYISYAEYCREPDVQELRPWCANKLPSIYTFVQDHYWNVGFFRYWKLPNLPLFLLAAPMLALMGLSALWAFHLNDQSKEHKGSSQRARLTILRTLAVSQLILTLITFTGAHVQIITRVSSAYPVWLWYVATLLEKGDSLWGGIQVRFMVVYAITQGGLFASFLPPA